MYGFCDTLFRRSKPLKNSCGGSRLEKRENPLEGLTIGRGTYLRSLAKDPPSYKKGIFLQEGMCRFKGICCADFRIYSVKGDHNI